MTDVMGFQYIFSFKTNSQTERYDKDPKYISRRQKLLVYAVRAKSNTTMNFTQHKQWVSITFLYQVAVCCNLRSLNSWEIMRIVLASALHSLRKNCKATCAWVLEVSILEHIAHFSLASNLQFWQINWSIANNGQ